MNSTIYSPCNQCSFVGLERELKSVVNPDGSVVRLFIDHKGWRRIALFSDSSQDSGLSGVAIMPDGEIYYKETAKHAQGNGYTRQLQAQASAWGVLWYRSHILSDAGAACYKS